MEQVTFVVACKKFFGFKSGQTLMEFKRELDELTDNDKTELTRLFPSVGYEIVPAK